jgi:cold shock protein
LLRRSAGATLLNPFDAPLGVSRCTARCRVAIPHQEIFDMDDNKTETGTVKWFNESKGYGFITPDNGGKDLFAHFREIQGTGFKSLPENARVQFSVTQGAKGPQASNIVVIA